MNCPACGFANQASALFCGGCATPLHATPSPEAQAERRVLSVVFCDIVGSTAISERIDAEDFGNLLGAYHQICVEVVRSFGGSLGHLMGDGVVIHFGYPIAHEDDEVRAVRCALAIQDRIKTLATTSPHPFEVRIGAHRGRVVVGALGGVAGNPSMAIGETPNLASRLQSEAEPGSVVVSDTLWRLVSGVFLAEALGVRSLKGIKRPVEIYKILEYRPDRLRRASAPFFVGRTQELELIRSRWQRALEAHLQVVLIRGEPGIGKSRLIQELAESLLESDSNTLIQGFCVPFSSDTPFYPIVALMRTRIGLDGLDSSEQIRRLARRIEEIGLPRQEALPLLARFLSIEIEPGDWPILTELSPLRLRQRTMDLVLMALFALAEVSPVVLIIEDLHWADPSTIDLLQHLVKVNLPLRVLILLSSRLEFRAPWEAPTVCTEILLDSLLSNEAESLIRSVASDKAMPSELVRQICSRSAGNPLFLEEVTLSVIESPSLVEREKTWELVQPFSADLVPSSVEAALMSRLDHLGATKALLQLGATLGREFSLDLLDAVVSTDIATLERMLNTMVEEGFLRLNVDPPPTYTFKHALIQDTAYESLLRSTRQENHARIASVIVDQFPDLIKSRPELLAHHLSGGGRFSEAALHWEAAGQAAAERCAVNEAVDHFLRGLADLENLPQSEVRWQRELSLHTALAPVQMAAYGWASPVVESTCLRAIDLAGQLGADDRRFAPLWGLWSNQFVAGRLQMAVESARQVHDLAAASGVAMYTIPAHHASSYTHFYRGEYQQALKDAGVGIELSSFELDREIARIFQLSPLAAMRTAIGGSMWMLGHQDEGIDLMNQMLDQARLLNHPPTLAGALAFMMHFCFYDRDWYRLYAFADELLGLASAEGFYLWRADAGMHRAKAILELNFNMADGGDLLEWCEIFDQTRAEVICGTTTCIASQELHRLGSSELALAHSIAGEQRSELNHVRVMAPEILRVRGDIYRDLGRLQEADQAYQAAVSSARRQGALSLELRSLTSLLAHRRAQGPVEPILGELRQVQTKMQTSPDRPDLKAARALLAEFSP